MNILRRICNINIMKRFKNIYKEIFIFFENINEISQTLTKPRVAIREFVSHLSLTNI